MCHSTAAKGLKVAQVTHITVNWVICFSLGTQLQIFSFGSIRSVVNVFLLLLGSREGDKGPVKHWSKQSAEETLWRGALNGRHFLEIVRFLIMNKTLLFFWQFMRKSSEEHRLHFITNGSLEDEEFRTPAKSCLGRKIVCSLMDLRRFWDMDSFSASWLNNLNWKTNK